MYKARFFLVLDLRDFLSVDLRDFFQILGRGTEKRKKTSENDLFQSFFSFSGISFFNISS